MRSFYTLLGLGRRVRNPIISIKLKHHYHYRSQKRYFAAKHNYGEIQLVKVLNGLVKKFEANGISDPSSSAEYITAHILGKKTLYGVDANECFINDSDVAAINNLCEMRLKRMPVQYILGQWDFDGMTLEMKPPVFIPRPETEELVGHCQDILESNPSLWQTRPVTLELGCGSGAISLALLKRFKGLESVCVDVLPEACDLTKRNASIVGVEDRIRVINGDFTCRKVISCLHSLGPFCLLVSNPPYVTLDEMEELSPEIERFESPVALNGGVDGLDIVRHILNQAEKFLMLDGHILLEVGENHPAMIKNIVTKYQDDNNTNIRLQFITGGKDIYNRDRFCHLQLMSSTPY